VDVINLGHRLDRKWGKINPKIALVFRTGATRNDGQPFDIGRELTLSMADKANLRKFLESWRGRAYTSAQLLEGVPLHKLVGQPAMLNIVHGQSQTHPDRMYARIDSIMPPMKGFPVPALNEYERAEYWAERQREYANELLVNRAEQVGTEHKHPADQGRSMTPTETGTGPGRGEAPASDLAEDDDWDDSRLDDREDEDDSDDSLPF
jgi:hypothetical protein